MCIILCSILAHVQYYIYIWVSVSRSLTMRKMIPCNLANFFLWCQNVWFPTKFHQISAEFHPTKVVGISLLKKGYLDTLFVAQGWIDTTLIWFSEAPWISAPWAMLDLRFDIEELGQMESDGMIEALQFIKKTTNISWLDQTWSTPFQL